MVVFRDTTGVRKQLSLAVLAADGTTATSHSLGVVDHYLSGDLLFES